MVGGSGAFTIPVKAWIVYIRVEKLMKYTGIYITSQMAAVCTLQNTGNTDTYTER